MTRAARRTRPSAPPRPSSTFAPTIQPLRSVSTDPPSVVLSDVRMPGEDGIALLRRIRRDAPDIDVVIMTAYDDMQTVAAAMREESDNHHCRRWLPGATFQVCAPLASRR